MIKYRVTAKLTGNTDDNFFAEVEANNEDEAWAIAYKSQLPRGIYNGKVEELPTREEQAAEIVRLNSIIAALVSYARRAQDKEAIKREVNAMNKFIDGLALPAPAESETTK